MASSEYVFTIPKFHPHSYDYGITSKAIHVIDFIYKIIPVIRKSNDFPPSLARSIIAGIREKALELIEAGTLEVKNYITALKEFLETLAKLRAVVLVFAKNRIVIVNRKTGDVAVFSNLISEVEKIAETLKSFAETPAPCLGNYGLAEVLAYGIRALAEIVAAYRAKKMLEDP